MTPDEIALDVVLQLRWDNDTRWHEIIAAAIAAERAAREKAEAELEADRAQCMGCLTDDEKDQTISELSARAEKAEAERDEAREALTDARDNGLIYWEPNTERGHIAKAQMVARIDAILALIDKEPRNG